MAKLESVLAALVPPLCVACGGAADLDSPLCGGCERKLGSCRPLAGPGPAGVDGCWSAAAHEGVARELVVSLKYRRLAGAAAPMAERMAGAAPAALLSGTLVAVPAARLRRARRGYDVAGELVAALELCTGLARSQPLRRRGGRRQVGRRRAQRLGDPPRVEAVEAAPRSVLLVDDVLTTGATLSACAHALRRAGAIRVAALTFTRRL